MSFGYVIYFYCGVWLNLAMVEDQPPEDESILISYANFIPKLYLDTKVRDRKICRKEHRIWYQNTLVLAIRW